MRAPVTLMIGDDTYPVRDFVRIHLQHHLDFPALQNVALGYTLLQRKRSGCYPVYALVELWWGSIRLWSAA